MADRRSLLKYSIAAVFGAIVCDLIVSWQCEMRTASGAAFGGKSADNAKCEADAIFGLLAA
jgi:glucuronate isomerase